MESCECNEGWLWIFGKLGGGKWNSFSACNYNLRVVDVKNGGPNCDFVLKFWNLQWIVFSQGCSLSFSDLSFKTRELKKIKIKIK
jgi:hypothetical protein